MPKEKKISPMLKKEILRPPPPSVSSSQPLWGPDGYKVKKIKEGIKDEENKSTFDSQSVPFHFVPSSHSKVKTESTVRNCME